MPQETAYYGNQIPQIDSDVCVPFIWDSFYA